MFIIEVPVSSLEIHYISRKKTYYEIVTEIGLLSFSTNVFPFRILPSSIPCDSGQPLLCG